MSKLIFRYGAMGSSKTANALIVAYNYKERGKRVLLLKPIADDRSKNISSRIGLSEKCLAAEEYLDCINDNSDIIDESKKLPYDVIIIDEVQFLEPRYIDLLAFIVDTYDIPVICYGLKTDFTGHLFEGSKRLLELADNIEEIPTICWCGRKARFNARIADGKVIKTGNQIQIGGNESYVSLCRKHFNLSEIGDQ